MQGELNSLHNAMKGREGNFRLRAAAQLHIFSDWSQERSRDTVAALHEPAQVPHSARCACMSLNASDAGRFFFRVGRSR